MDASSLIMYLGFTMAAYSVVGNDTIQTLGTFLSSNERTKWWVLWLFAGGILAATLVYGWVNGNPERFVLEDKTFITNKGEVSTYAIKVGDNMYFNYKDLRKAVGKEMFLESSWEKLQKEENAKKKEKYLSQDFESIQAYQLDGDVLKPLALVSVKPSDQLYNIQLKNGEQTQVVKINTQQFKDVSYGRLEKYDMPFRMSWYFLLPPIILLLLTRTGIPVSTSFLILTFFNPKNLDEMVKKSMMGYLVAFGAALLLYFAITKILEKRFIQNPIKKDEERLWTILQWCSTGFLWGQWLIQDFANIYVYLPRDLSVTSLVFSLVVILGMLAYIIASKGGAVQSIVKTKTNTIDIRSATIIDFVYGLVLFYFKELNNVPMSTTWVFIGILAGREIAINIILRKHETRQKMFKSLGMDLVKVMIGLVVSIILVYVVKYLASL